VHCGYGATRIVLVTKRWAIKFPTWRYGWRSFLRGLLANMQERSTWEAWHVWWRREHPEREFRYCPIRWALPGGWLVVMPRVELLKIDIADAPLDTLLCRNAFAAWVEELQRQEGLGAEPKPESFGWYNNRLVAFDYGN